MAFLQGSIELEGAKEWEYPYIARWENCREQGYVVHLRTPKNTLHIAFFEHRNSDSICAIRWEEQSINSPTIETAKFNGQCYKDKYDVSFEVNYGEVVKMADWILSELTAYWISSKPSTTENL